MGQYDVELLRQYFYEKGMSINQINEHLNTTYMPFDKNYVKWENETKFELELLRSYIKKNRVISSKIQITEVTNHKDNAVFRNELDTLNSYIFTSSYLLPNEQTNFDYNKRKYSQVLFAKGLYQDLNKLIKYYLLDNKDILLGICKSNENYFIRTKDYYKLLKSYLEKKYTSKKFVEIEDEFNVKNQQKKIYLLKSE